MPSYLAVVRAMADSTSAGVKAVNACWPCSSARIMPLSRGMSAIISPAHHLCCEFAGGAAESPNPSPRRGRVARAARRVGSRHSASRLPPPASLRSAPSPCGGGIKNRSHRPHRSGGLAPLEGGGEPAVDLECIALENLRLVGRAQRHLVDIALGVVVVLPRLGIDALHGADHLGGE